MSNRKEKEEKVIQTVMQKTGASHLSIVRDIRKIERQLGHPLHYRK